MDERIDIPQDLKGLSADELTELGTQIRERVEGLADEARESDDTLAEVEGLISSFDAINEELSEREQAAAARSERLDLAMSRFSPADENTEEAAEEAPTEDVEDDEDEVVEAAEDEVVEAAADETVEASTEDAEEAAVAEEAVEEAATEDAVEASTEEEAVVEAATEEEAVAEAATDNTSTEEFTAEEDTTELVTDGTAEASITDTQPEEGTTVANSNKSVAGLSEHRPDAAAPRSAAPAGAGFSARGIGGTITEGQTIDIATLAAAIVDKQRAFKAVPSGPPIYETLAVAAAEYDDSIRVSGDLEGSFSTFRTVAEAHSERVDEDLAVVASGGVCAPLQQDYDFFRLAEEMNPVERALPLAAAPRGGIRYIQPPDFRDAAPGVRITTEDEDAAGYVSQGGPTPDKPCVAVECPPIQECRVDAVSRCVTFGNLNYRVFPEQVQAFLADLSVIFTETKEIFYLDAIDAASTPVTSVQTYSAVRTLIYDLLAASANYRRRHHMRPEATLQVLLPSWLPELLKVDMVNDHALGLNFIDADMRTINSFFAKANLDVAWYYDSATGASQEFNGPQGVGDLNSFPTTTVSYLFAPGTFVRLDAGTLDVGLVRDSILNGTNDLQLFAEQWIQVCMVGLESLRIEHTLCPDGTAPEAVTPFTCPTGNS